MHFKDTNFKLAIKNLFLSKKRDVVVLEPHLGLGDGVICLALVRELVRREPNTRFYYVCLPYCYHTLAWMFQDLKQVYLFVVDSGRVARQLSGFLNARYMPIGLLNVDVKRFDEVFYEQHQTPFVNRWENCYVPAGPQSDALYERLNSLNEPYILVCSDGSAGTRCQLNIENGGARKVIQVSPQTNNLYDWTKLILLAEEIHTIDTAFAHLVESVLYPLDKKPMLYYHLARKTPGEFTRKLPWNYVEY